MTTTFGAIDVIKAPPTLTGTASQECAAEIRGSVERHSQGLEMLLDCNEACLKRGGELVVAGPTPLCAEVLDITGLEQELNVHKDLRSALGSFAR